MSNLDMIGKTLKDTQERDLGNQSFRETCDWLIPLFLFIMICVPVRASCIQDSISINCIPDIIVVSRVSSVIALALRVFLISGVVIFISCIPTRAVCAYTPGNLWLWLELQQHSRFQLLSNYCYWHYHSNSNAQLFELFYNLMLLANTYCIMVR